MAVWPTKWSNRRRVRPGGERGVAAVEFAIILPLLMMVLFGIMGFGFAMAQSASLASGAREGARLGAVNGVAAVSGDHDCGDVVAQAREQAQTIGVSELDVEVTVARVSAAGAATTVCSAGVGAGSPSGGVPPCTDAVATAATEATVRVTTKVYDRAFVIPVPGVSMLTPDTLQKSAEYRCEYH